MDENKVSLNDQIKMGLIQEAKPKGYVVNQPVSPARRPVGPVIDVYAENQADTIRYNHVYTSDPMSRAKAYLTKAAGLGFFMGLATLAVLVLARYYPPTWGFFMVFMLYLGVTGFEVILLAGGLALIDWYENPASMEHKKINAGIKLMDKEQQARFIAQYGLTPEEIKRIND